MVEKHGITWCTSGVWDLSDVSGVGQVFRCWACASRQERTGMEARWKLGMGKLSATLNAAEVHCTGMQVTCIWHVFVQMKFTLTSSEYFPPIVASLFVDIHIVWKWKRPHVVSDGIVSCKVWDGLVCHRFCPQALAEALKVNKTVTTIDLSHNEIGNEGAKAWCLARGSVAPGLETVK